MNTIEGTRYHSLIITSPKLKVTAQTADQRIMAIEDTDQKIFGIQFHPESVGTKAGIDILRNFLSFVEGELKS